MYGTGLNLVAWHCGLQHWARCSATIGLGFAGANDRHVGKMELLAKGPDFAGAHDRHVGKRELLAEGPDFNGTTRQTYGPTCKHTRPNPID